VDGLRVGRSIRALRIRRGWRQADLAKASDVARSVISRIELGAIGSTHLQSVVSVCAALGADLEVRVRWQGEGLDRLLDQAHSSLVERFVDMVRSAGWEVAVEATFNVYGERGSVDVLAWHSATRSLLIGEIKSVVADAQGTFAPLDRKVRHGARIARDRDWDPATISSALVVRDGSTNRRRIADLGSTFEAALPARGTEFRRWLRAPSGRIAALIYLPDAQQKGTRRPGRSWQRVSRPRHRPGDSQ